VPQAGPAGREGHRRGLFRRDAGHCRERTDPALDIRYAHANCEDLAFLAPRSFDLVVSNMVLMDLADHRAALQGFCRLLVEGGILLFSILHPCFHTPGSGWVRDGDGAKLYWKVDGYFQERAYEHLAPKDAEGEGMLHFHRTLFNYVRSLLQAGFCLLDVVEPKPAEAMLEAYPDFRHDLRRRHFIVFKAQRTGRP
jgi:SAM-dependent methyltransferase